MICRGWCWIPLQDASTTDLQPDLYSFSLRIWYDALEGPKPVGGALAKTSQRLSPYSCQRANRGGRLVFHQWSRDTVEVSNFHRALVSTSGSWPENLRLSAEMPHWEYVGQKLELSVHWFKDGLRRGVRLTLQPGHAKRGWMTEPDAGWNGLGGSEPESFTGPHFHRWISVRLLPSWFLIHAGTYQSHGTTTVPKFRSFGIASVGLFENGVTPNPMINHHFSIKTAISWDWFPNFRPSCLRINIGLLGIGLVGEEKLPCRKWSHLGRSARSIADQLSEMVIWRFP